MKKKSLDIRTVGTLMVLLENGQTPEDADWDAFLDELRIHRKSLKDMRLIVFTDGGGPNSAQRKRLQDALGGGTLRVAVVTDRVAVRFIVSSIALFHKSISTFKMDETHKAYEWLALSDADRKLVDHAVLQMRDTVA